MQVYQNSEQGQGLLGRSLSFSRSAVALGGFDAIHIGHQAIIRKVVETAKAEGLTSVVYLFCNQPRSVVKGQESPGIYPLSKRLEFLEELGVDVAVAEWFTPEFQEISPEVFVKKYLKDWLCAEFVAAGFDYRFGHKGSGDMARLQELCQAERIQVYEQAPVLLDGEIVSSTRIRRLLQTGAVMDAEQCLGRPFSVSGTVVSGNRIGRTIGFPTANVEYQPAYLLPKQGVYLTKTKAEGSWYPSITHLGARPTVTDGAIRLETHLLQYQGDLYGKKIEVAFVKFLREVTKFKSLEDLQAQLCEDKKNAEI